MQVVIMRGLPGGGKSTHAKNLSIGARGAVICSADDFHMKDGKYEFRIENSGAAHTWCLARFLNAIGFAARAPFGQESVTQETPELVIVDNTNCSAWEVSPYYQAALAVGASVKIIRAHCNFETACRRNTHAVPRETIWRMHRILWNEQFPPHWKEEIIFSE